VTLATTDPWQCPDCDTELTLETVDQPAIVRHGGYGGTRRTLTRHCPHCGYSLNHITTELPPAK
jgi:primosomal protein N'